MLMRLVAQRGTVKPPSTLSFRVTQLHAPRGTDVAMVGTRASCHPIPVLITSTPHAFLKKHVGSKARSTTGKIK
jgi:hypothetical protein